MMREVIIKKAKPCICGSTELRYIQRSNLGQHWIVCDSCGNAGPCKSTFPQAGRAWNKQQGGA